MTRVILGEGWSIKRAWLIDVPSHEDVVARLAARAQRLLSPEEWEYACGAGVPTLFRWGDAQPDGQPYGKDGVHRLPNAFGLKIGQDPYREEITATPYVVRGGDGGRMDHRGEFVGWLTLATSFRDPYLESWLKDDGTGINEVLVRPAIEVDDW